MHYLISKGYIPAPSITEERILKASKTDKLAKTVALTQSLYVLCQVVARAVRGLGISCLEIITLSFLSCAAPTYFFWLTTPSRAGGRFPSRPASPSPGSCSTRARRGLCARS